MTTYAISTILEAGYSELATVAEQARQRVVAALTALTPARTP